MNTLLNLEISAFAQGIIPFWCTAVLLRVSCLSEASCLIAGNIGIDEKCFDSRFGTSLLLL